MKITLAILAALTLSAAALDLSTEEAQALKTYDLHKLEEVGGAMDGTLVRVKFTSRTKEFEKNADGSISGELYQFQPSYGASATTYRSGSVTATIPAIAADWFIKISTDYHAKTQLLAYARVGMDERKRLTVTLLGKNLTTDSHGAHITW